LSHTVVLMIELLKTLVNDTIDSVAVRQTKRL